jgi:hypothetical protein
MTGIRRELNGHFAAQVVAVTIGAVQSAVLLEDRPVIDASDRRSRRQGG